MVEHFQINYILCFKTIEIWTRKVYNRYIKEVLCMEDYNGIFI